MIKRVLAGCFGMIVIFILIGIIGAKMLTKAEAKSERTETVSRGDVEVKVVETGTIDPLRKVEVKSKVGGKILKLFVDEGAVVRQGQILARIDPVDINTQVAALKAQLAGSGARLQAARKNVTFQRDSTSTSIDQYRQNVKSADAHVREAQEQADVQPELTRQAIDIATANLEAARATLKAQQDALNLLIKSTHPNTVVSVQVAYDQAKTQADNSSKNLERQKQLMTKGFVAQQAVDSAQTDYDVAKAHVRDTKERLDRIQETNQIEEENLRSQVATAAGQVKQTEAALAQAKSDISPAVKQRELEAAKAALAQARAQLANARAGRTQDLMRKDEAIAAAADARQIEGQYDAVLVQQHDTTLYAPMDGVVTKKYLEAGELIESAIASFGSGSAVFQVADLSTMLIKINVNEVDISKVTRGMRAELTVDAERGATFVGSVRKVAPAAISDSAAGSISGSTGSSGTGSVVRFPVEVVVSHADRRLKPGMSARCAIIVARRKSVLRLPINCVMGDGDKATVQLATTATENGQKKETVQTVHVKAGLRGDDFVEILSGLKQGDHVRPNKFDGPPRPEFSISVNDDNGH